MSELLHFSEHTLQEVAIGFMVLVYTTRIIWFLRRFKAGGELSSWQTDYLDLENGSSLRFQTSMIYSF